MKKDNVFFRMRLKNSLYIDLIVAVILAGLLLSINFFMTLSADSDISHFMRDIVRNDGFDLVESSFDGLPPENVDFDIDTLSEPPDGFRDYFTAEVDGNKKIVRIIHGFSLPRDTCLVGSLIDYSIRQKKNRGHFRGMEFLFEPWNDSCMLVVVDKINGVSIQRRMLIFSILIFMVGILIFFIIAWWLSKLVVKPVEDAFNKQRQFVSDVSHELKTPIAVISANISALENEVPKSKWLGYIKMENERMGQLVADMLYLAREDAGVVIYEKRSIDFANLTACAVLPFETVAYEQGKRLNLDIPGEPLDIVGDESRLKQAIIILIDNAMKNSDSGADVTVTVGRNGQKAFVKVRNTGQGIAESEREKIFNRFYRSDASRSRDTGGCGLGLSIAQAIAMGHGGKISVESVEGSYAEFTLSIPVSGGKKKNSNVGFLKKNC